MCLNLNLFGPYGVLYASDIFFFSSLRGIRLSVASK